MNKNLKNSKGITLIALVITIIVMLILVTVTIRVATDGNLFTHAANAAKGTKTAIAGENAILNDDLGIEDIVAEQTGGTQNLDWESILSTATKHPNQSAENNDIGIGTDGKPVNLDLWRYTELTNGWGLYGIDTVEEMGKVTHPSVHGYLDSNISNGKIQGTVPQYIKKSGENTDFMPVISMHFTFAHSENLTTAPTIPSTVTNMDQTFYDCKHLTAVPEDIPSGVTILTSTFAGCTGITEIPKLWERVTENTTTYQGTPDGKNCFGQCSTTATNYGLIPEYWRTNPRTDGKA